MTKKSTPKYRYHSFLLYPDSMPEDFCDKLSTLGVPMAISPLHDSDKMEGATEGATNKYKKPHYHVLYVANNPVTSESVLRKIQKVLGDKAIAKVESVVNMEGSHAYLTHESKDAIKKKKHVYDKKDITYINNFDISRYITKSLEEKKEIANKLCDLIRDVDVMDVIDLEVLAINHEICASDIEYREILASHGTLINSYLKANYQKNKRMQDERWLYYAEKKAEMIAMDHEERLYRNKQWKKKIKEESTQ